jgi:hypothetical protein
VNGDIRHHRHEALRLQIVERRNQQHSRGSFAQPELRHRVHRPNMVVPFRSIWQAGLYLSRPSRSDLHAEDATERHGFRQLTLHAFYHFFLHHTFAIYLSTTVKA